MSTRSVVVSVVVVALTCGVTVATLLLQQQEPDRVWMLPDRPEWIEQMERNRPPSMVTPGGRRGQDG